VSHPTLGLPPRDINAGHRRDADALREADALVAVRALEAVVGLDPTFRDRYSDVELRKLLADLEAMVHPLATAVSTNDPGQMARWAEMVAVRYRKRGVPMDDVVTMCEGLRRSAATVVEPVAMGAVDTALDACIAVLRWHRRLAGDARKRNPLLAFLYKGA
jgi:putative N-acetylmannosamine-6-phosphate epimerase